jgi:porphobilinogen synthase
MRRLRRSEPLRRMVRETRLAVEDLIYPLFVTHGRGVKEEIGSLPNNFRWSLDTLVPEVRELARRQIPAVLLFGIPVHKDEVGSEAYDRHGAVQEAVRVIKQVVPEMVVVTDVCLCEYTSHGHCGVMEAKGGGDVLNGPTLEFLAKTAPSHAEAGADMVAPSDMMDGRVAAIRRALDDQGYSHLPIMAYSTKYASAFYGPF